MEPLNRQDEPPEPGPETLIIRVSPKLGVDGIILSKSLFGVFTHWDGRRTRECTKNSETCAGCLAHLEQRWKGYLSILSSVHRKHVFLELTPTAARKLLDQVDKDKPLRGFRIRVGRTGESMKGRITVDVMPCSVPIEALPQGQDPEAILRKLWGWPMRGV